MIYISPHKLTPLGVLYLILLQLTPRCNSLSSPQPSLLFHLPYTLALLPPCPSWWRDLSTSYSLTLVIVDFNFPTPGYLTEYKIGSGFEFAWRLA